MKEYIKDYMSKLCNFLESVLSTDMHGKRYELDEAIEKSIHAIIDRSRSGGKVIFIGNGASASIASHMAVDFWKNGGIRAISFNDSALLTCISNDYGYEHVFEKPIEMFAGAEDLLIAISSSGKSENIIRAALAARKRKTKVITLSGFNRDNPLRKLGDINFYVPAKEYGYVEVIHHFICHCMGDMIIKHKNG